MVLPGSIMRTALFLLAAGLPLGVACGNDTDDADADSGDGSGGDQASSGGRGEAGDATNSGGSDAAGGAAGEGSAGTDGGAGNTGASGGPDAGSHICRSDGPAVPIEDISGTWAYVEVQAQIVRTPAIADPFMNLVVTGMLMEQTQEGEQVTGRAIICHRHTDSDLVGAAVPRRLIDAIEPFDYTATYDAEGTFTMERVYLHLGYHPDDPSDESELPTEADDPLVYDQDEDGEPGATIVLSGLVDGMVFTVQWATIAPDGRSVAEDRIEGLLDFNANENVLGSEPAVIASFAPESTPAPEPCWSTFQMARAPEDADCDWLEGALTSLFPDVAYTFPE